MNVLYTCDNNYVWLMGISTISLFENNQNLEALHVYLLGEQIDEENKKLLKKIADKYSRDITVIDVPALDIPDSLISARWPLSAFTRLYAGDLLPLDISKILYLDCDTIIKGSVSELDSWEATGYTIWGVKDCVGKEYKKNIGLQPNGIYINAGVLLINLQELRKISIKDKLSEYMRKYEKYINYADQDVLNGSFAGTIGVLPPEYDVMTIAATYCFKDILTLRKPTNYYGEDEINKALKNPTLIHYTTNMRTIRPWYSNTNHPFAEDFRRYMEMSPWRDRELHQMIFNSREAKIIKMIEKLPDCISKRILGYLHSVVKPLLIRSKAR